MIDTIANIILLLAVGACLIFIGFCLSEIRQLNKDQDFLDRMSDWGDDEWKVYDDQSLGEKDFLRMNSHQTYRNGLLDGMNHRIDRKYGYNHEPLPPSPA